MATLGQTDRTPLGTPPGNAVEGGADGVRTVEQVAAARGRDVLATGGQDALAGRTDGGARGEATGVEPGSGGRR